MAISIGGGRRQTPSGGAVQHLSPIPSTTKPADFQSSGQYNARGEEWDARTMAAPRPGKTNVVKPLRTPPILAGKGYVPPITGFDFGMGSLPGMGAGGVGGAGGALPFGSTVGAGGGGSGVNTQAQANPYLQQVMDMYKGLYAQAGDLYNKPLDFAKERADMRTAQSQKLNELRAAAGAGGRGGMWGSTIADVTDEFGRDIAGAEAGFGNRSLEAKRNILGDMSSVLSGLTGASSATAGNQMQQLEHQLGMQQLGLKAWEAQMQLPLEYYKAQQAGQMNMLNLVKALV